MEFPSAYMPVRIAFISLAMLCMPGISLKAQSGQKQFADKEYYLVDSLNLNELTRSDMELLDSALKLYHAAKHDTLKLKALDIPATYMMHEDWIKYNQVIYDIAVEGAEEQGVSKDVVEKYRLYEAFALDNFGLFCGGKGDVEKALDYYNESLAIQEEIGDKAGIANSLNSIGVVHKKQGHTAIAMDYFDRGLKIFEEINNTEGMAVCVNNIGILYVSTGDVEKGLEFYKKSYKLYIETGDRRGQSISCSNIGAIYGQLDEPDSAFIYMKKGARISEEIGDHRGLASALHTLGKFYLQQGDTTQGTTNLHKSRDVAQSSNNKPELVKILITLGNLDLYDQKLTMAKGTAEKALQMAKELGFPLEIQDAAKLLQEIYEKQNRWEDALEMHKVYITMRDSLQDEEANKAVYRQQINYEYEKKEQQRKAEEEKLKAIAEEKEIQKNLVIVSVSIGMVFSLVFLGVVYNRFRITRKQKQIIEKQSMKISDSISYAQRIQKAVLPSDDEFKSNFKDSFIYFKPKDVVSGDFYWFYKTGNKIFFSVIDCTGHGVPGAFMSLISTNLLDKVVAEQEITSPEKILNQLNTELINRLSSDKSSGVNDGMDLVLCCVDKDKKKLEFAGARNTLFLLRNNEIQEFRGDNLDIGNGRFKLANNKVDFTLNQISLQDNDSIYLFSDGYVDQFGGPKGTKFYIPAFADLIKQMGDRSMEEQKEEIHRSLLSWIDQGQYDQLDDICVMGIKV